MTVDSGRWRIVEHKTVVCLERMHANRRTVHTSGSCCRGRHSKFLSGLAKVETLDDGKKEGNASTPVIDPLVAEVRQRQEREVLIAGGSCDARVHVGRTSVPSLDRHDGAGPD